MNRSYLIFICVIALFLGCGERGKKITANGRIELDEIIIASKVTGKITNLKSDEGDKVKKDELLGFLDLYEKKKRDLERAEALFKSGALSEDKLEDARIAFDDQCIISSIDGVVLLKPRFEGETVAPGQAIITVGNLNEIYAKVFIPEVSIGKIRLGMPADIKVDSFPDKRYKGEIIYIADFAEFTPKNVQTEEERARRVYAVKIRITNENDELKPGMPCDAIIEIKS